MSKVRQRLIDLVHERDGYVAERARITRDVDDKISRVDSEIDSILSGGPALELIDHEETVELKETIGVKVKKGTNAEKVLRLREKNPRISFDDLVVAIYGSDSEKHRHNLRSVLWNLRRTGRIPGDEEVSAA